MTNLYGIKPLRKAFFLIIIMVLSGCGEAKISFANKTKTPALTQQESFDLVHTARQQFSAGKVQSTQINVDTKFKTIDQAFTLQQLPKSTLALQQSARKLNKASFTQGFDGWTMQEQFSTKEKGKLDLLIVMDNSSPMAYIQDRVSTNLAPLISDIANTDWQIAVITTSSACLRTTSTGKRSITRDDYNQDPVATNNKFKEMITIGSNTSPVEQGILYATQGMIGNCGNPNDDWKRPGSHTAVMIISDEKNCGSAANAGCPGKPYAVAEYFTAQAPANTQVFGLFLLEDNQTYCPYSGGYENEYPTEYVRLVQMTHGSFGDICQADYSSTMEQISANIENYIVQNFTLAHTPSSALQITLDGTAYTTDYVVQGQTVVMQTPLPTSSSHIQFTYKYGAAPRLKSFALATVPDSSTITVVINSVLAASPTDYSYNAATNSIDFVLLPPDQASIGVSYRDNAALANQFPLSKTLALLPDSLDVQVGSQAVTGFVFDATSYVLTLPEPPLDGDTVTINYAKAGDKTTNYAIAGISPQAIEHVSLFDAVSLAPLAVTMSGSDLVVTDQSAIYEGRAVTARYRPLYLGDALNYSVPLANVPIDGSLQVVTDGTNPNNCASSVQQAGGALTFSCSNDAMDHITVQYSYAVGYTNIFNFQGTILDDATWIVEVDGKTIQTYQRDNNQFTIDNSELHPGSVVMITRVPPNQL